MKKIEREMISELMHMLRDMNHTSNVEVHMEEEFGDEWLTFRDKMW